MAKAMMFDFWGTLIDGVVSERTLLRSDKMTHRFLKKKGYDIGFEDYGKRRENAFEYYNKLAAKGTHLKAEDILKRAIFHDINIKKKDIKEIIKINELYDCEVKFRKGCRSVLKELKKRGYEIALVSNS